MNQDLGQNAGGGGGGGGGGAAAGGTPMVPPNLTTVSDGEIVRLWNIATDDPDRDRIIQQMKQRGLFPKDEVERDDLDGGLYPEIDDPNFVSRLLQKTEFADTVSRPFDINENPCEQSGAFEVTPVQRFVANFLHPRTPYMSALLYHGVGVGKTCAAIQAAEAYLDMFPRRKVLIVCPRAIRSGFMRTIFDASKERLSIGSMEGEMNNATGCTGNTYLKLAGCLFERDRKLIEFRTKRAIDSRYAFFGYAQFANYIRNVLARVPRRGNAEQQRLAQITALKREFNYRFLVIDEAHNLRDVSGTAADEEEEEEAVNQEEAAEADEEPVLDVQERSEAKILTPQLIRLLQSTDGMKLLLMSATPMFNTVFEIVFLLNLMLMNDKRATITQDKILTEEGKLAVNADKVLKPIVNAYISFMRGENPNSFPLRLFPDEDRITEETYPVYTLNRAFAEKAVTDADKQGMSRLPLIMSKASNESDFSTVIEYLTENLIRTEGMGYNTIDSLLQANNCVYPKDADEEEIDLNRVTQYVGITGFNRVFEERAKGVVKAVDTARWLGLDRFGNYSPKGARILSSLKTMEGVGFVYSRFVKNGALLLALALEANGYTPYGRTSGFLADGIQTPGGRQCALCSSRQQGHPPEADAGHKFVAAKYVLLTGNKAYSPNNALAINEARNAANKDGRNIKVVIGSQIASEGVDLRFIREIHVLDPWFHLNKTEQIVGRGIRYCSHSLLPSEKRNTTVFLHTLGFASDEFEERESADLYVYRTALRKAMLMGDMSRRLKVYAVDCNLRHDVTVLKGLGDREQIDSQGERREVSLDDTDYTAMCDWMECEYQCNPVVDLSVQVSDDSTYDAFSAQYRESMLQKIIQRQFAMQPYYTQEDLMQVLKITGAPELAIQLTLQGIINNPNFRVKSGAQDGYIIYKNKYFLFQPNAYRDTKIPLALRVAAWPIKEDIYTPKEVAAEPPPPALPLLGEEGVPRPEEEDQEQKGVLITQKTLWRDLTTWVQRVFDDITAGNKPKLSQTLEVFIDQATDDEKLRLVYKTQLRMIPFLMGLVRADDREQFKQAALEYLWDSWINQEEQVRLLLENSEAVRGISPEQVVVSGGIRAVRIVNATTNTVDYYCEDGKICAPRIASAFEKIRGDEDPVKETVANDVVSGQLYGFIVPKYGLLVFKTIEPGPVGQKPDRGQECQITTIKSFYLKKLILLGDILREAGLPDLHLSKARIDSDNVITSVSAGCAVIQLVLRFMNTLRVGGKIWFYRPIASLYSKHVALIRKQTAKKTAADAPKRVVVKPKTAAVAATAADEEEAAAGGGGGGAAEVPKRITVKRKPVVTAVVAENAAQRARNNEARREQEAEAAAAAEEARRIQEAQRAQRVAEEARRLQEEQRARNEETRRTQQEAAAAAEEARRLQEEQRARDEETRRAQQEAAAAAGGGGGAAQAVQPPKKKLVAKPVGAAPKRPIRQNE
jgi:hypothetical protein